MRKIQMTKALPLAILLMTAPLRAEVSPEKLHDLVLALHLPAIMDSMAVEGIDYGAEIGQSFLPSSSLASWDAFILSEYKGDKMLARLEAELGEALADSDVDTMLAFFTSEPAKTIIALEASAREAMLDEAVDQAAKDAAAKAAANNTPRFQQIERFGDVLNLVDLNVMGAMNSNYAFFMGLLDGGAMQGELTREDILNDVWSSEPELRASSTEWMHAFMGLAYQPVSDADLEIYIGFSETDVGQDLNRALFVAFDVVFDELSRNMGLEAAHLLTGAEL